MLDSRELEPALTEKEMLLRDGFVSEYLKDFDSYKACLRMGFKAAYAVIWAKSLFEDGYVQRKLSYIMMKPLSNPEQEIMDRAMVENTLRLVMQRGSDSARVSAARELNAMKGWSRPDGEAAGAEALIDVFKDLAQQLPA